MPSVSASYTMPTIMNALMPATTSGLQRPASTKAAASSNGSTTSSDGAGGLGSTFLSLLAQELQNQDPTAPVDPTAMVGQMISLNQLQQLISINQTLTPATTPPATSGMQPAGPTAISADLAAASGGLSSAPSPSTAGAAINQLPFDPNTMMPLGFGKPGTVTDSINSSINAVTLGLSGTNKNASGGK